MSYDILKDTPYGGEIHVLRDAADLEALPVAGRKLLSAYQVEHFRDFPDPLLELAETAKMPAVAAWLRSLAQAQECRLEVCLTEYAAPLALVRYTMTDEWTPALSFQTTHDLPYATPTLLRQIYDLVGRINFDGYGYAGGLLCPPDKYPDLGSYNEWREEAMPDYDGFMAFYEIWTGDKLLVNKGGQAGWYIHDDAAQCRLIGSLETVLPALFEAFAENRQLLP